MAKAVKAVKMVEVIKVEKVPAYTLELSKDEAETLFALLGFVGGEPQTTARKYASEIYDVLEGAGISRRLACYVSSGSTLMFKPTKVR